MAEERWPEPVARILRAAGWHPGRQVDTASAEAELARWNIEVSPRARALLAELGGIECEAPSSGRRLELDVERALFWMSPDDVPWLTGLVGEPLVPFGAHAEGMLLVAPSGVVVALDGEWLGYVRYKNVGEALEHYFFPRTGRHARIVISDDAKPSEYREDA